MFHILNNLSSLFQFMYLIILRITKIPYDFIKNTLKRITGEFIYSKVIKINRLIARGTVKYVPLFNFSDYFIVISHVLTPG